MTIACTGIKDDLHVLGTTEHGTLWPTIRFSDTHWQAFGDVLGVVGQIGAMKTVSAATVQNALHVCVVRSDGRVLHTIRTSDSKWQGWGDVSAVVGSPSLVFNGVTCTGALDNLHLVGFTADDHLLHTFRAGSGAWQAFIDLKNAAGGPGSVVSASLDANQQPLPPPPPRPTVRAVGSLTCKNSGMALPMSLTRIDIKRLTHPWLTEVIGSGGTDQDGHFDFEVAKDTPLAPQDKFSFTIILTDEYAGSLSSNHVRAHTDLGSTLSKDISAGSFNNGTIDFGAWTWGTDRGDGNNSSQCGVFQRARGAYRDYERMTRSPVPFNYNVHYWDGVWNTPGIYPFTVFRVTHWPRHFGTGYNDGTGDKGETSAHEFAHAVRDHFDGDETHWHGDDGRYRYGRSHELCDSKHLITLQDVKEGFAFHEGWAEYWETYLAFWYASGCSGQSGDMTVEGEVAKALKSLETCPGVGPAGMARVLEKNPGQIYSFQQFRAHYDIEFPNACVGDRSSPIVVGPPPGQRQKTSSPSFETHQRFIQQKVSSHAAAVASITTEREQAAKAVRTLSVCNADCYNAAQTLIAPHFLNSQAKLHELLRSSLEDQLRERNENEKRLYDGSLAAWSVARAEKTKPAYAKTAGEIVLTAMGLALSDLERFQQGSPSIEPFVHLLKTKIAELEESVKHGNVPPSLDPALLLQDDEITIHGPQR
jgi:hypothetical protein